MAKQSQREAVAVNVAGLELTADDIAFLKAGETIGGSAKDGVSRSGAPQTFVAHQSVDISDPHQRELRPTITAPDGTPVEQQLVTKPDVSRHFREYEETQRQLAKEAAEREQRRVELQQVTDPNRLLDALQKLQGQCAVLERKVSRQAKTIRELEATTASLKEVVR